MAVSRYQRPAPITTVIHSGRVRVELVAPHDTDDPCLDVSLFSIPVEEREAQMTTPERARANAHIATFRLTVREATDLRAALMHGWHAIATEVADRARHLLALLPEAS